MVICLSRGWGAIKSSFTTHNTIKKLMTKYISYSALLVEFIDPLLDGKENDEEFLMKAKAGQIAWNYAISDKHRLPFDIEMKNRLKKLVSIYPEMKETFDMLVIRKGAKFAEFNQYIFTVETRDKIDGSVNLYVESAPADKIKKHGD